MLSCLTAEMYRMNLQTFGKQSGTNILKLELISHDGVHVFKSASPSSKPYYLKESIYLVRFAQAQSDQSHQCHTSAVPTFLRHIQRDCNTTYCHVVHMHTRVCRQTYDVRRCPVVCTHCACVTCSHTEVLLGGHRDRPHSGHPALG